MTPGIIDALKMIDIDKDNRTIALSRLAMQDFRLNLLNDGTVIGQTRQPIGQGLHLDHRYELLPDGYMLPK